MIMYKNKMIILKKIWFQLNNIYNIQMKKHKFIKKLLEEKQVKIN